MSKKDLKNALDIIKKFYKDHFNISYQLQIINSNASMLELLLSL